MTDWMIGLMAVIAVCVSILAVLLFAYRLDEQRREYKQLRDNVLCELKIWGHR